MGLFHWWSNPRCWPNIGIVCIRSIASTTTDVTIFCWLKTSTQYMSMSKTIFTTPVQQTERTKFKDFSRSIKDLKLQFSSTEVMGSGGCKSPSGVHGRAPVGKLKYNVKFSPLKNRLTTHFCHVLLCIVCTILRYCWNIQIQGLFRTFKDFSRTLWTLPVAA